MTTTHSPYYEPIGVNRVICDAEGKTLVGVGDSVWVSGSCVPGTTAAEMRKSRIIPPDISVDSAHAAVVYRPVTTTGIKSPLDQTGSVSDGNLVFASRLSQPSNEFFIYVNQ